MPQKHFTKDSEESGTIPFINLKYFLDLDPDQRLETDKEQEVIQDHLKVLDILELSQK